MKEKQFAIVGSNSTRELLSDYAHEAWCGWMKYMFSIAEINDDGTWTMPKWAVERWQRQMNTKYSELPEEEKKSDREEADKILSIELADAVNGSLPSEIIKEAKEILTWTYITKIDETPPWMKRQKRILMFCKTMAEFITRQ